MHQETKTETGGLRVACGAKGSIWTSLDIGDVTCYNCVARTLGKSTHDTNDTNDSDSNGNLQQGDDDMSTSQSSQSTPSTPATSGKPKVSADDIKRKIQEAKDRKAAGSSAGQGKSAILLGEDDAPMPKATTTGKKAAAAGGVRKQQVQSGESKKSKAAASNGMLNLCGCGCAQPCRSNFIPGHDAKLHSWIKKLRQGRMKIEELVGQVRDGMYAGVKQKSVTGADGKVELAGIEPTTSEEDYLKMLKGKGGKADA